LQHSDGSKGPRKLSLKPKEGQAKGERKAEETLELRKEMSEEEGRGGQQIGRSQ